MERPQRSCWALLDTPTQKEVEEAARRSFSFLFFSLGEIGAMAGSTFFFFSFFLTRTKQTLRLPFLTSFETKSTFIDAKKIEREILI